MEESELPLLSGHVAQMLGAVQCIDDAISERLSGFGEELSPVSQLHEACEQLRTVCLDAASEHLVSQVEWAPELLQETLARPAEQAALHGVLGSEITLLNGIWRLEADLASISDGGHGT